MTASNETWHHAIIASACEVFERCVYLEIGVSAGACLGAVAPHASEAIGVDVRRAEVPGARFVHASSDEFFATWEGEAHVIFIDGDHAYEQARRDFDQALDHLAPGGIVFLHDTHPLSEVDTRERVACGDVWRLRATIAGDPRFESLTWTRFPGLTMVRRRLDSIHRSSVIA